MFVDTIHLPTYLHFNGLDKRAKTENYILCFAVEDAVPGSTKLSQLVTLNKITDLMIVTMDITPKFMLADSKAFFVLIYLDR